MENNLHWSLDVTYQEDFSKKRTGYQVENFNILLKIALTILRKEESTKISLKNKRMKAAFDKDYSYFLMLLPCCTYFKTPQSNKRFEF